MRCSPQYITSFNIHPNSRFHTNTTTTELISSLKLTQLKATNNHSLLAIITLEIFIGEKKRIS